MIVFFIVVYLYFRIEPLRIYRFIHSEYVSAIIRVINHQSDSIGEVNHGCDRSCYILRLIK